MKSMLFVVGHASTKKKTDVKTYGQNVGGKLSQMIVPAINIFHARE